MTDRTSTTRQIKRSSSRAAPATSCAPCDASDGRRRPLKDPAADAELAAFAKAIGHPVRMQILRMLAAREARLCCHIVDELPLAQSTVSEHLRILKAVGLVKSRQDGQRMAYCIEMATLRRLQALLNAL